jgi:hypothetical protein
MRLFTAALLAASFFFPSAIAEPLLPPGKPAGVEQAGSTSQNREVLLIGAVVLVSAGAAIALVGTKSNTAPTSTSP